MTSKEAMTTAIRWPPVSAASTAQPAITSTTTTTCDDAMTKRDSLQHHSEVFSPVIQRGDRVVQTVGLEGSHPDRQRYLCLVSHDEESEYGLLGLDRADGAETTVGLVIQLQWGVKISLDGDGGFSLCQHDQPPLVFKPVSVQALWTVIQTLHMISERLTPTSAMAMAAQHADWLDRYAVSSPQSSVNEWHEMDDVVVRRPPSPDKHHPEEANAETVIKTRLRQIMSSVDLDSITSKSIRKQLEGEMHEDLEAYKSFIDNEMLIILGQMDPASRILDYLYLGSEWNASNLDELHKNGITHVLNVTREIDNFFPGTFTYMNIRVYDVETTDLLKDMDRTYKFIRQAHRDGGRVLVHCKVGMSRSATVVISYVMKEHHMRLEDALHQVRTCRPIVKPNKSFLKQLEVYEGMLGAISHRHTYFGLFRSKSESFLQPQTDAEAVEVAAATAEAKQSAPDGCSVDIKMLRDIFSRPFSEPIGFVRPKSWSPPEHDNCQCFGEVARSCSDAIHGKAADMDLDEGLEQSSSAKTTYGRFLEARNPVLMPVNTSRLFDPECHCDLEVELRVPAGASCDDHRHTDAVVRRLSTLPLQMRTSQSSPPRSPPRSPSTPKAMSACVVDDEDEAASASSSRDEELSVKTLANLFDFKGGSVPLRPCSARLEDSHLFKKAKRLSHDGQPQSDC